MIQEVMDAYTNNLINMLIVSFCPFACGYMAYIYSTRLIIREKKAPFPMWMHTVYLAHDFTGAVVFYLLARNHNWFWLFSAIAVALLLWNGFEIFNLYMAVKVERQAIWGKYYDSPVTEKQALARVIGQIAMMFVLVNYFRVLGNDEVQFKWFAMTNVIMGIGPGFLWNQRKSRDGTSIGLAIVILLAVINTFLPPGYGMWTTALSFFHQPWFYITGVVASAFALRNLIMLIRFPAKETINGKKPIW